jgi:signal transduction histidine kinase
MRACPWHRTGLGPPETWPASLVAVVRVVLTSRFAMWMAWGSELTFLCNDAYLPTVGLKRDWVIGSRSDRVWAEIWPDIGPRIERVLATGEATWDEALLLYLERNGFTEESYHTFSYSPLADDAGATTGMLCVVAEVTERVIGERQLGVLRDVGARLAGASTREAVITGLRTCLADAARDIPFAVVFLDDRHGVSRAPAVHDPNGHLSSFGFDAEAPRPAAWRHPGPVDGGPVTLDLTRLAHGDLPEGAPRQALTVPIAGVESGEAIGCFVAGLNPYRLADANYRSFIGLVAAQVAAAITRADEFERARERADALAKLDRAKTAFFSNVSHEFRTPLTLMLGPLEDALADLGHEDPVARERLDIALRNAMRLLRLVNQLLDFSRIEAGRNEARRVPTDLAALTADLASSFRSATDRAGLTLSVETGPLSRLALVDRDMWETIVLNLVSNAFKFTFTGGIAVGLSERDGMAVLTVRDSGIGIPASEAGRLFDRFHRVEGARGRSFEGSGIGLALARELVRLHGGDIVFDSEEGRGTEFRVTIPLGAVGVASASAVAAADGRGPVSRSRAFLEEALRWLPDDGGRTVDEPATPAEGAGYRVLLADDSADLRSYIGGLLKGHGYVVQAVADGEAALAALRARRPDILVTDVMMPRLDGFGLLAAVRDDTALRDLPVVILSARAGDDAKVEGLGGGADDYLTKPFSARELLARVAANIATARLRREAAEAVVASETRAREQAEEALRQSQKMEAVGQLTGGLAHDFNNLLTGITGSLQLLETRLAQGRLDAAPRHIEAAQSATKRAAALTQRLLAFSRPQNLDAKPADLNRLVAEMDELVRRTTGSGIELDVIREPALWPVLLDQNQFENALLNLCINARDAMPEGGRLTIRTANDPDGDTVSLSVSDEGVGMSDETIGRIFEPFFTTKPSGQGTGLGLSMTLSFVRQAGGEVRVASEVGKGTTMSLHFPRHLGSA